MPYSYRTERNKLFTEEGQVMFLKIRDLTRELMTCAGAARLSNMIARCGGGVSWTMLACVDRLVELGEIREVTDPEKVSGQDRVFVSATFLTPEGQSSCFKFPPTAR